MKKLTVALVILVIFMLPCVVLADNPIYESVDTDNITRGVIHENIVRFTKEGWLNINVIKADINDDYLVFSSLVNNNSIQTLTGTDELVRSNDAVAGVNGGFFNWSKLPGLSSPIGPIMGNGDILSLSSDINRYRESMATFYLNNDNHAFIDYWKSDIYIYTSSDEKIPVERYNVQLNNNGDLTILTRKWGEVSFGLPDSKSPFYKTFTQVTEMVVVEDKVVEIRENLPPVEIPSDGYVVVAANSKKDLLLNKFKVGDGIKLEIGTSPDYENISTAITGGAIILRDGKIVSSFSHDSPGKNPRTALGYSKDGKTIYMVAVDGRQQRSIGMTLTELAEFMKEIGAHGAVNLDGGGSTALALRKPGTRTIEVTGYPSDGMARRVANAFGIISVAPGGSLGELIIVTDENNMFADTEKAFEVRALDSYGNPCTYDAGQIEWSFEGVEGSFNDNIFYASSPGKAVINAQLGNVNAGLEINVLSAPSELMLNTSLFSINSGDKREITVRGIDQRGFSAPLPFKDVNWAIAGNIGDFSMEFFHAQNPGMGFIEAEFKGIRAYCGVSVFSDAITVVDDFEKPNGTYLSYPADIRGEYGLTDENSISGAHAGRLTYDFSESKETRASYVVFSGDGIPIPDNVNRIGVWIHNEKENPNWIRALLSDGKGQRYYLDLSKNLDFTGWKYAETSLSDIGSDNLTLLRLYIVQTMDIPDKGVVLFDDLTFVSLPPEEELIIEVPQNTPFNDPDKRVSQSVSDDESFSFAVFGRTKNPVNPLENLLMQRLAYKLKDTEISAFIGEHSIDKTSMFNGAFIKTYIDLISKDYKNSRFISLDTRKFGLRLSNSAQWKWFLGRLNSFDKDNVFIFSLYHPDMFSDKLEGALFKNTLSRYAEETGRNVWVFYGTEGDFPPMENSVKYLYAGGLVNNNMVPERAHLIDYVKISVSGRQTTYEILPVLP